MDPKDIKAFRELLITKREELESSGEEFEPNRRDALEIPDEDTQPLNEMHQVIASRKNKTRAMELAGIEDAIKRLDEDPDLFGECEECEEEIPIKRLQLMPWASKCVSCQGAGETARGARRRHMFDYQD